MAILALAFNDPSTPHLNAAHSLLNELADLPEISTPQEQIFIDGLMAAALKQVAAAKRQGAGDQDDAPDAKALRACAKLVRAAGPRTSAPVACLTAATYAEPEDTDTCAASLDVLEAAAEALRAPKQ